MTTDAQVAVDEAAVRRLLEGYFHALDVRDMASLRGCFAHDAVATYYRGDPEEMVVNGREAIVVALEGAKADFTATTHSLANSRVRIDGDCAEASTHAVAYIGSQPWPSV